MARRPVSEISYPASYTTVSDTDNIVYCTYEFSLRKLVGDTEILNDERLSEWFGNTIKHDGYRSKHDLIKKLNYRIEYMAEESDPFFCRI